MIETNVIVWSEEGAAEFDRIWWVLRRVYRPSSKRRRRKRGGKRLL